MECAIVLDIGTFADFQRRWGEVEEDFVTTGLRELAKARRKREQAALQADIATMGDALLREVRLFEGGAEATDDLTVLTFRYQPPAT